MVAKTADAMQAAFAHAALLRQDPDIDAIELEPNLEMRMLSANMRDRVAFPKLHGSLVMVRSAQKP